MAAAAWAVAGEWCAAGWAALSVPVTLGSAVLVLLPDFAGGDTCCLVPEMEDGVQSPLTAPNDELTGRAYSDSVGDSSTTSKASWNDSGAVSVDCCPARCPACCCSCGAWAHLLITMLGAYHGLAMAAYLDTSAGSTELRPVTVTAVAAAEAAASAAAVGGGGGGSVWIHPTEHNMRLHCVGAGSPTVVFLHGYSGQALDWSWVQPVVAAVTKTCSFDRSGCGLSAPGPGPRTSEQIVAEAYALLDQAGLTANPVVVVGHSFGGYHARLLRARYPALVAAMVLVDPAPPLIGTAAATNPDGEGMACSGCHSEHSWSGLGAVFYIARLVAPFGLAHPLFAVGFPALVSNAFGALAALPPDVYSEYTRPLMGWQYYDTNVREAYWWRTSEWQVGATADVRRPPPTAPSSPAQMGGAGGDGSMGSMPYVLFTAERGLERGWRLAGTQSVCFDFGTYGDRAASLAVRGTLPTCVFV